MSNLKMNIACGLDYSFFIKYNTHCTLSSSCGGNFPPKVCWSKPFNHLRLYLKDHTQDLCLEPDLSTITQRGSELEDISLNRQYICGTNEVKS